MNIKERIIKKIEILEDTETLKQLENFLNAFSELEKEFRKEEIYAVHEGYSQFKSGNLIGEEEVNRHFKKWSEEK